MIDLRETGQNSGIKGGDFFGKNQRWGGQKFQNIFGEKQDGPYNAGLITGPGHHIKPVFQKTELEKGLP